MHLKNKQILVTGTNSGFGKFASSQIKDCVKLTRENKNFFLDYRHVKFDAIIHCAFNSKRNIDDFYSYYEDNILLTENLIKLNYKKFIYISSIDVKNPNESNYGLMKKIAESIVRKKVKNNLIIRPSAILGQGIRKNSLIRILQEDSPKLTLSEKSTFNYILQEDMLEFISKAIAEGISGEYDFTSSSNVTLGDIARKYDKKVLFGNYVYQTHTSQTKDTYKVFPKLNKDSIQVVEEYMRKCK